MYIYNITYNIESSIEIKWIEWMHKEQIPAMLGTKKFDHAQLVKVLVEEDMGGITYSVQYQTDSKQTLEQFYKEDADAMQKMLLEQFAGQMVHFTTELQVISKAKRND